MAPWVAIQPVSSGTHENTNHEILILASGAGPLQYQWRKDGAPVANGGNIAGATTPKLSFAPAYASDSGEYDVVVTNGCGKAVSEPAAVTIIPSCIPLGCECYPNCNQDNVLDISDFGCFSNQFIVSSPYSDCNADAILDIQDFGCFVNKYILGCTP